MTTQGIDLDVEKRLGDHEIRYTRGRRAVVNALHTADGPMSAAELNSAIGSEVPLSSLYRTLAVLEEAKVVMPHFGARGVIRYELAEWLSGHHHHVVCVDCGNVEDIDIPERHEDEVRKLVDKIAAAASFEATGHVLEIEGRCAKCQ